MDLVKELREKTQVGMMDCKKALEEADGDMEKAIEFLRKKGSAVAAKRADHATNHGRIETYLSPDFKQGSLVAIGCETDFSANTQAMKEFALLAAQTAAQEQQADPEKLLAQNQKLKNNLDELVAKISEKIHINRISCFKVQEFGLINAYVHPGSTIATLIELTTQNDPTRDFEDLKNIARDICMHIAVTNPLAVSPDQIDASVIEKERAIAQEQLKGTNKPAAILEKIIEGKLNKYYEDVCLTKQRFIKNEDLTIEKYLNDISEKLKNRISIKQFTRFAVGK